MNWLLLQLADSAFPTGSFAHSLGLEALKNAGEIIEESQLFFTFQQLVIQCGWSSLPYVARVADGSVAWSLADAHCHATCVLPVAARASRTQGRALLETCAATFGSEILALRTEARAHPLALHAAPVFGAITQRLGVSSQDACAVYLHGTLRTALSAAVRLGLLGPAAAQRTHFELHSLLQTTLERSHERSIEDVAQSAPWIEMLHGTHDTLYSRLFQS